MNRIASPAPLARQVLSFATLCALLLTSPGPVEAASRKMPGQFVAKLYTEALGRLPDKDGWLAARDYFSKRKCTVSTLGEQARSVLLSPEFAVKDYPTEAQALLVYRTLLDREPRANDLAAANAALKAGTPLATLITQTLGGAEFKRYAALACAGQSTWFNALGVGSYAVAPVGELTQTELQAKLNAAGQGGTVMLTPMTVVRLSSTLTIPDGVTLATEGLPRADRHGVMARLVRAPGYAGELPLIRVNPGATLASLWIDGQRGAEGVKNGQAAPFVHSQINIQTMSGKGTRVADNFIANTAGWSSLQVLGSAEIPPVPCVANRVTGNVITVYASNHDNRTAKSWADGISASCEDAHVAQNQIVDATDVGIVLFRSQIPGAGAPQRSLVEDNLILNAGNSAFGALAVDPLYVTGGCAVRPSFKGAVLRGNRFWAAPDVALSIGIAVGTAPWFFKADGCLGEGVVVTGNTTAGIETRMNNGIAVQGMLDADVTDNDLAIKLIRKGKCRKAAIAAGVGLKIASGRLPPHQDIALTSCI